MSSGRAIAASEAVPVAARVVAQLAVACRRVAIAGSLRRGLATVRDVELVCEPHRDLDLLGEPAGPCQLAALIEQLCVGGHLRWRTETHATPPKDWRGPRRVWSLVVLPEEVPLDLFAVRPPAQWGAILAIRTGPASYSQRLVTRCQERGFRCAEGRLVDAKGRTVHTPEERDFIETCGLPWFGPEFRT